MRITNSTIIRGYNRDLNRIQGLRDKTMHRIITTRRFNRASEEPLSAAKALNVRKSLFFSAQYKENLKVADSFYTEAETSLLQVSDKLATIRETIIAAANTGIKSIDEYNIYAQQLENDAQKLCAIFNTNTAGRAIFGGESDDGMPFKIEPDANGTPATVTYHGVPVSALNDEKAFPYSKDVLSDIGLGIEIDQKTQEIDPQSALRISFNGVCVSGCGSERGVADIDLTSIKKNKDYCIDVYADNVKKTISFKGSGDTDTDLANIQEALDIAFRKSEEVPVINKAGQIVLEGGGIVSAVNNPFAERTQKLTIENDMGYTDKYKLNFSELEPGREYTAEFKIGDVKKTVTFMAGEHDDPDAEEEMSIDNLQAALNEAFKGELPDGRLPIVSKEGAAKGIISCEGMKVTVISGKEVPTDSSLISAQNQIDTSKFTAGEKYNFTVAAGTVTAKISFTSVSPATDLTEINQQLYDSFQNSGAIVSMTADGKIHIVAGTVTGPTNAAAPAAPVFDASGKLLDNLEMDNKYTFDYKVGNVSKSITFRAGRNIDETVRNLNRELATAFAGTAVKPEYSTTDNKINVATRNLTTYSTNMSGDGESKEAFQRETIYSSNYIQLTLDCAKALRNGDIAYANGCIDRIVSANEKLLIEIANLGCNEDFISFNIDRITTRETNLYERQNDLETADLEKESTLMKTYSAIYNACLQMASEVVPNSIFNYMK